MVARRTRRAFGFGRRQSDNSSGRSKSNRARYPCGRPRRRAPGVRRAHDCAARPCGSDRAECPRGGCCSITNDGRKRDDDGVAGRFREPRGATGATLQAKTPGSRAADCDLSRLNVQWLGLRNRGCRCRMPESAAACLHEISSRILGAHSASRTRSADDVCRVTRHANSLAYSAASLIAAVSYRS